MRSFWNGSISFGLVNIPVSVFPATKSEIVSFHFLHEKDLGRIHNQRLCEVCEKVVPYDELVRGYEYEDDKYLPLTPEDFENVNLESAKNIDILDFVKEQEIDPIYFDKPYYLVPDKKGQKAYALLRETLEHTGKVGIAKVIFHTREHLAAVRTRGEALMLDILHFATEIKSSEEMSLPAQANVGKKELAMAEKLVANMTSPFRPEKYKDTYKEKLETLIEEKLSGKSAGKRAKRREPTTNVIDIMSKLKASLKQKKTSKVSKRKSA